MMRDDQRDVPVLRVVGAAVLRGGRCLAARRSAEMAEPMRWEFPGGKVEPSETPQAALRRELHEELGIEVEVGELVGVGYAYGPARTIELTVYAARLVAGELVPVEHDQTGWFDASALPRLDWAAADIPIVPLVCALLGGDGLPGEG